MKNQKKFFYLYSLILISIFLNINCRNKKGDTKSKDAKVNNKFSKEEIEDMLKSSGVMKHHINENVKLTNGDRIPLISNLIDKGKFEDVKFMLKHSEININNGGINGYSPLIASVAKNNIEILKLLLKKGADANQKFKNGESHQSALYIAVMRGHKEVVKLLIENGADVNIKVVDGKIDVPLIYYYVKRSDIKMIQLLINKNVNIDTKIKGDTLSITCLCDAIMNNKTEIAKLLIENGSNSLEIVNLNLESGTVINTTPLHIASQKGLNDLIKLMKEKSDNFDVNIKDSLNRTPLIVAELSNHIETVNLLKSFGAN